MIKKAGLYIRVSTEKQVEEGYSIAAQKEALSKFAINQGWDIFDTYADEGISGKNIIDRPEVRRLIEDIKKRLIDVVILYRFDRLTRNNRDTEDIINIIQEFGVEIFTISGGAIDVSTATGRFQIRINGAVAMLEREQTIERIKIALEQKVKEGYTLASATTCYGYNRKKHDKNQTINKKEASIVKKIFTMYADGKSFTEISNILNLKQIPAKLNGVIRKNHKTGKKYTINSVWTPKTIKLILTNPTYIGKVRYHVGKKDEFISNGNHEPIIDINLWNLVQDKIKRSHNKNRTNLPKEDVYYCGTLICGICGHKLTTNRTVRKNNKGEKKIFNGYRCPNREKNICTFLGVSHNKIEKCFNEFLDNLLPLSNINQAKTLYTSNHDEINHLKKRINSLQEKKKHIMDLFILNNITSQQLNYMNKQINKKVELLKTELIKEEQLDNINNKKAIPSDLKTHWAMLTGQEKITFLNEFVEKIIVKHQKSFNNKEILEIETILF